MYEVFDKFLVTEPWHKCDLSDELKFLKLLDLVVGKAGFSPKAMGQYMRSKFDISSIYDADDYRNQAINRYTAAASVVLNYLSATGRRPPKNLAPSRELTLGKDSWHVRHPEGQDR